MREVRNVYKILVRKPEGKRPLGRPRHKWENNIKMDLKETAWEDVDLTHMTLGRCLWQAVVNILIHLQVT
jgi:hypothetical protein